MTSTKTKRERKKNHMCVYCGGDLDDGYVACKTCRGKHNKRRTERGRTRKDNKECPICGKPRMSSHVMLCEEHHFKSACSRMLGTNKDWKTLKAIWDNQNGKCAYTGEVLCMGVTASIDHILPVSKYPELKNDINNIQWVSIQMNAVKNDLTELEMVNLFKTVIDSIEQRRM